MDFFDLINNRKSIRHFTNQPIEQGKIDRILETVRLAPSAGNLQAFKIILIHDNDKKKELSETSIQGQDYTDAPLIMVFCAWPAESAKKYQDRGYKTYCLTDATIACAHAQLAVHALGLSCVWVGAFNEDKVCRALNISDKFIPVAILPIGYANEESRTHEHKTITELIQII